MKFDVTRYGPSGFETITVEAEGGDDAAAKAFKPGMTIRAIIPAEVQDEPKKRGRPASQGEDA